MRVVYTAAMMLCLLGLLGVTILAYTFTVEERYLVAGLTLVVGFVLMALGYTCAALLQEIEND